MIGAPNQIFGFSGSSWRGRAAERIRVVPIVGPEEDLGRACLPTRPIELKDDLAALGRKLGLAAVMPRHCDATLPKDVGDLTVGQAGLLQQFSERV